MKAGDLRHKVQIQNPTEATDSQGGAEFTWATVGSAWAAIEPLSSREQSYQATIQVVASHKVTLRYTSLVTNRSRLLLGSRVLDVVSRVSAEERGEQLLLICNEVS
jgi:SPP1 family predicted phage head-tail adaptor